LLAEVTKNEPSEFCEIEQTAGVDVVKVTGNFDVARAVSGKIVPKVATEAGLKVTN
jgi:hypothetical protein